MSYPVPTLDGVLRARITLIGPSGRAIRNVDGSASLTPPEIFLLPWESDSDGGFTPERTDGGDVNIRLDDTVGMILTRRHLFRPRFRFQWTAMTADEARDLRKVLNHLAWGGEVHLQPHSDLPTYYQVIREPDEFITGHPGGIYIGHTAEVVLIASRLILRIPMLDSSQSTVHILPSGVSYFNRVI